MKKYAKITINLALCFIFIFATYYLVPNFSKDNKLIVSNNVSNDNIKANLSNNAISLLQEHYNNTDIKGIISMSGTSNFNYPVVQGSNNDYYLNHDYYKNYDIQGSIMADYRVDLDNSKKILIYGHSSSKKDVPFNQLENYYNAEYYQKHSYLTLETKINSYKYEIFSVYVETSDFTYMNINFDNEEEWYRHILKLQKKSLYNTNATLNKNDDILILQTCSNNPDYQDYSKKYLLVVSRRVK